MSSKTEKEKEVSLYETLELEENATREQINSSFRRLSLKYHPDKNPEGTRKFQEINLAHKILSDDMKRKIYDRYGMEGLLLSESTAQFVPSEGSVLARWLEVFGLWFAFVLIDWITGYPIEWLASLPLTFRFVYALPSHKLHFIAICIVCDCIIYYCVGSSFYFFLIEKSFFYLSLLLWANIVQKMWDFSTLVLIFWTVFDWWFDRPERNWEFLGVHTFTICSIIIAFFIIILQTRLEPNPRPSYVISSLTKLYQYLSKWKKLLVVFVWLLIWVFDYLFSFSFEWIFPVAIAISFLWKGSIMFLSIFLTLTLAMYYWIPVSITSAITNFHLHIVSLLIASSPIQEHSNIILLQLKSMDVLDYVLWGILIYIDFFYRHRPQFGALLAAVSASWLIILFFNVLLSDLIHYLENKQKNQRGNRQFPQHP